MRLGGPVTLGDPDPEVWIAELERWGYGAAIFPLKHTAARDDVQRFTAAAATADVVIAEVGAWSNPMSRDDAVRRDAIAYCQHQLALADEVGARCCVNISGSRGEIWDGPDPDNLTPETFDLVVETTRAIIDAVRPTRTHFTLEAMPWMYPDSPDSYLRLIAAIDRDRFGVHLDPVNMVSSPQRYFGNGDLIRESFRKLGPHIRNCHAKDITLATGLTVHLDEVRPGLGILDYATFLRELSRLDPDTSVILEHLAEPGDYRAAGEYVRGVAAREGLTFIGG
ncbi:MAG: Xylose isomerase domain protein TIM barrel [uncultured Thermomicrobiales bacterium]|uniref:Xylose isomerase domain protein TIM barrel n=1 Tax=uncultured Thermomicrobiales bacterium TaxID=1645740 RepID=A0A6J4VK72_9BACT|nr:MAG: Xylose isomerase domain protein TIM barrel [uncultured Thermomicrobiales bacterium]